MNDGVTRTLEHDAQSPRLRPRFKPHVSTLVVVGVLAATLVLASIPGQIVYTPDIFGSGKYGSHFGCYETCHHGWPFTFMIREPVELSGPPYFRLSLWNLADGVQTFSLTSLVSNIAVMLGVLILGGMAFEWRRRHTSSIFQLSLIDALANLDLTDTYVNDDAMPEVGRLLTLKDLSLTHTLVTDEGLRHLSALRKLRRLWLSSTDVGDDGLQHLYPLQNLEFLALDDTDVTDAGVEELALRLPNCEISN